MPVAHPENRAGHTWEWDAYETGVTNSPEWM